VAKPGSVVSHVVAVSWDERHLVAVAEVALVFCLDLAQVGRRATGGGGPAVVAGQSWGVVRQVGDRDFSRSRSRFMTSNCPIPPAWSLLLTGPGFSNVTKLARSSPKTVGARRQGRDLRSDAAHSCRAIWARKESGMISPSGSGALSGPGLGVRRLRWDLTAGVTRTALVGFRQGQLEDAEETAAAGNPNGGEEVRRGGSARISC
jgi:hypothetical protein